MSGIGYLFAGFGCYVVIWWLVFIDGMGRGAGVALYNPGLVLWEGYAAVARRLRGLPTFGGLPSAQINPFVVRQFVLELERLPAHLQRAYAMRYYEALVEDCVLAHRSCYPPSQARALQMLFTRYVLTPLSMRERVAELERRMAERARQHRQQRQFSQQWHDQQAMSPWRRTLGVSATERDPRTIKQAYRQLARTAHPDRGGSTERMAQLNAAMDQARKELGFV